MIRSFLMLFMILWKRISAYYKISGKKTKTKHVYIFSQTWPHQSQSVKPRKVQYFWDVWLCLCAPSYPVPAEPWLGPLWLSQSPALCRPRWLHWCPTGGRTRCPTSPRSAPQHGPPRAGAPPSDARPAGRQKEEFRWETKICEVDLETLRLK